MDELMEWARRAKAREEIREVICRSLMDADQGRADYSEDCYTKDGRSFIAGKQTRGPGSTPHVVDPSRVAHTHFAGPTSTTLDGDTARCETYAVVWAVTERDGKRMVLVRSVRYLDRLVKEAGRWLIDERRHNLDWQFEAEPSFSLAIAERVLRDW